MTLKRRIRVLEKKAGEDESLIVFVSKGADGKVDLAVFADGPNKGLRLDREEGESSDAFKQRTHETSERPR